MSVNDDMAKAERLKMEMGGSIHEHLDEIRRGRKNGNGYYKTKGKTDAKYVDDGEFDYWDKDNNRYGLVRKFVNKDDPTDKNFKQFHWDGKAYVYGAPKPKIPYWLPELIAASPETPVFICEGEKDADNVVGLGLIATCSQGPWSPDLNVWFKGKQTVYIIEDNDDHGRLLARKVAKNLKGTVNEVRIVSLPDLAEHGDVSDWIAAGGTKEELLRLCAAAPHYSEPAELAPAFSEEDLALRFSRRHGDELRYVAAWNKWYRFDGQTWKPDDTRNTFSLARNLCREVASGINKPRDAKAIANAKTRAAVVALAGEDRRLAATVDQWDTDLWALNTPEGVFDLRNGECRDARADDYMTKITSVAPDADCPMPVWLAFLEKVTAGDKELQGFLARMAGYALTGSTSEHALFFLYGTGGNGKGVFMNTLTRIMGDYHRAAPIETFTETNADKHPTELAMLRGARLVTSTETEEGRRWAESRLKALTGGDPIAARFMRQDFFEYTPQFKLMISGNHKPGLRSVDEAIRRRINMLPFVVTIPPEERDKDLGTKLVVEYPGILAWMIKGCEDWRKNGLAPPTAVADATASYLENEDAMGLWIELCCAKGPDYWTPVGALFERWKVWAEATGETVGTIRRFSQRLEADGFKPLRRDDRGFIGLTVYKNPEEPDLKLRQLIWLGFGL